MNHKEESNEYLIQKVASKYNRMVFSYVIEDESKYTKIKEHFHYIILMVRAAVTGDITVINKIIEFFQISTSSASINLFLKLSNLS